MAIQVVLYQIRKDKNSTMRPSGNGNPYQCEIKDASSVINPTLIFNFGQTDYPSGFNYVQIPIFENRCYWITDWTYYRGTWQATCRVDPLASWRADIGASVQYILRSAAEYNGYVMDRMYPTLASQTFLSTVYNHPFFNVNTFQDGVFVVGVVSDDSSGPGGGVTYYQMDNTTMQKFRELMLSSIDWAGIDAAEISAQLSKALLNPYQYVVSCKWFPFKPPDGGLTAAVKFGWWEISLTTSYIAAQAYWESDPVYLRGIPQHPQAASRGRYLNLSPYTKRTLYVYPWGAIPLDTSIIGYSDTLKAECAVDLITGEGILSLYAVKESADVLLCTQSANIGIDVSISQIGISSSAVENAVSNPLGTALTAGGAALSSVLGGGDAGAIADSAVATLTNVSTKGTQGGIMCYTRDMRVVSQFFDVASEDNARLGRPLMERRQISTLPGYIVCNNPHIECHATANEIDQIEQAMASGFFYE